MKDHIMKRNISANILALILCISLVLVSGCGNDDKNNDGASGKDRLPDDLRIIVDNTEQIVGESAEDLSGEWADVYKVYSDFMHAGGDENKADEWEYLHDQLYEISQETDAKWVWVMEPEDGMGQVNETPFFITMDGFGSDPDDSEYWWTIYDPEEPWDPAFRNAWLGEVTSTTWGYFANDVDAYWTGVAPVYDSEDNVVCILSIEVPADELWYYPEWDGDDNKFNGGSEW